MPQRFAVGLAAVVLVLSGSIGSAARAQEKSAPAAPAQMKVGVVDLGVVFKQYRKSAELEQKINDERDQLRRELDEQKKQITNLLKELDLLDPDSETYRIKEDEKDAAVARFDRNKKRLEERIKAQWERYNLQLLEDIEAVVKAYGEEQKFALILKVDGKPNEETRLLVGLKAVLYHSKELDITPAIIELLNRRYDAATGGKPGSAVRPASHTPTPAPVPGGGK